jgi:glucose-6-phosphate-specific signal transduction histidine kinase
MHASLITNVTLHGSLKRIVSIFMAVLSWSFSVLGCYIRSASLKWYVCIHINRLPVAIVHLFNQTEHFRVLLFAQVRLRPVVLCSDGLGGKSQWQEVILQVVFLGR